MSSSTGFGSGVFGSGALGTQPFFNVSEMIDSVLYSTGHGSPSMETTKRRAILQFVNNRYQDIIMGHHWKWLKASYDFNFSGPYQEGSATAIEGDQTITGSGTVWSSNLLPKDIFFFDSSNVVYHVSSVASSTSLELETKFSEDDISDATSYTTATNQYKLPKETDNILSIVVDSNFQMVPLGVNDFRRLQAQNPTFIDTPRYYSLIRRDTDDDAQYIEVYPSPDKRYQVHIDYTVRIARLDDDTTCYPIIPDRYRAVLYYGALAEFHGYLRDPQNRQLAEVDYQRMLAKMLNDTQLTDQRLEFIPARNYRRRNGGEVKRFRGTTTIEDFGKED